MKILFLLTSFVIACSVSAQTSTPKGGWKDLDWTMTETQVKAKYPGTDPKIDVDGEPFVLRFKFNDSGKLIRVNLVQDNPEFPEFTLQKMEQLLTEKYGKPTLKQTSPRKTIFWSFKTVNVELMHTKNEVFSLLGISYIKPDDKAKSNL